MSAGRLAAQPSAVQLAAPLAGSVSGTVVAAHEPAAGGSHRSAGARGAVLVSRSAAIPGTLFDGGDDDPERIASPGFPPAPTACCRQLGYHPAEVSVQLARDARFRVSLGWW